MAIRLRYEKHGADLRRFRPNARNHSWAPEGRRRPATETRGGGQSGPERTAPAPIPAGSCAAIQRVRRCGARSGHGPPAPRQPRGRYRQLLDPHGCSRFLRIIQC